MTAWRKLHDRLLALHGGAAGLRDAGLLRSAPARPQQIDMAAVYTAGIVRNDPFFDDNNMRTARGPARQNGRADYAGVFLSSSCLWWRRFESESGPGLTR